MKEAHKQRLRRGVYLLPSFFTVGNLLCGYFSILFSARNTVADLDNAAKAIGFAIVFDTLDGRVARLSRSTSAFGKEFDSLADVISFGVAPAFLALVWGLRHLDPAQLASPVPVEHIYKLGWIATFLFVICGAWRLARFNLQAVPAAEAGREEPPLRYFVGLPIPAAAGMIAATVHNLKAPLTAWYESALWLTLVFALAALMVSPIRYETFKTFDLRKRHPSTAVIGLALLVWVIWVFSEVVLILLATAYVASGLLGWARRRFLGAPAGEAPLIGAPQESPQISGPQP